MVNVPLIYERNHMGRRIRKLLLKRQYMFYFLYEEILLDRRKLLLMKQFIKRGKAILRRPIIQEHLFSFLARGKIANGRWVKKEILSEMLLVLVRRIHTLRRIKNHRIALSVTVIRNALLINLNVFYKRPSCRNGRNG